MRRIKTLLLLALLTALVFMLAGCACKHEETILVNAVEATCTEDGYTGDLQCTKCEEIVETGEVIPATGHTPGELTGAVEPTCTEDGYTGDVPCAVCGEIVEPGEAIPAAGHTPGELTGAVEPTCTEDGYTGDIPCAVCGEIVGAGEAIPAAGHTPGDPVDAKEATCTEDGYTGDIPCAVCGEIIEAGEVIPATGHTVGDPVGAKEATCLAEGYTGDIVCAVCGEVIETGEAIEGGQHVFADHVCTVCGWLEPGLYAYDTTDMIKSWDELVAEGAINVFANRGQLQAVIGDMQMGRLVISEDVAYVAGVHNRTIRELWLPRTVTRLGSYAFHGSNALETVILFSSEIDAPDNAYYGFTGQIVPAPILSAE